MAWRGMRDDAPDVVLKLYKGPAQNPLFPNNPSAEAQLLVRLDDHTMTPRLRGSFETSDGQCNVYEHVPGNVWIKNTAVVAQLMNVLHLLDAPEGLRRVPDGSAELRAQIDLILERCSKKPDVLRYLPMTTIAPSGRKALLHTDIVPGNLIENETGIHLIDWQCPAVGDPCEDIAVFLSPAMQSLYRGNALSSGETETFLATYSDAESVARYQRLAPFYHARMAAYCQWQVENGQPEYGDGRELELAALQRSFSA